MYIIICKFSFFLLPLIINIGSELDSKPAKVIHICLIKSTTVVLLRKLKPAKVQPPIFRWEKMPIIVQVLNGKTDILLHDD